MPGVTHMVTWLTFFCSRVILSSLLHLVRERPAPSSFYVCAHAHTCAFRHVWRFARGSSF